MFDKAGRLKGGMRAKVEHSHQTTKRQFGFVKVRCSGPKKNTTQSLTLLGQANLWVACEKFTQGHT